MSRASAAASEFCMARPDLDLDQDAVDPQDQAETADETHLNEDADEFTTLEEAPNAFDDTAADDDDEDLAPLDESEFDDADADYEDDDDTDANDELDDTPDEFQPEVEWSESIENEDDEVEAAIEDARGDDEVDGLDVICDADSVEAAQDPAAEFESPRLGDDAPHEVGDDDKGSRRTRSD
jgi:hypothetical protein